MSDIMEYIADLANIRNNMELVESMFDEGSTAADAAAVYRILENQDEILEKCERTETDLSLARKQIDVLLARMTDLVRWIQAADVIKAHAELTENNDPH